VNLYFYAVSATITKNPDNFIIPVGPKIGDVQKITLSVESDGWPLPTFQWYRNGKRLKGETNPTIEINLHCPVSTVTRSYRCSMCKNFNHSTPINAFQVICMNCTKVFNFKEIKPLYEQLSIIHDNEKLKKKEIDKLIDTRTQMLTSGDANILSMVGQISEQIQAAEVNLHELRIARYEIKCQAQFKNLFSGEGKK
jgi:hypothetical protein